MDFEVKFLSVLCGDAIVIRYLGNDGSFHNILVDGGYVKTYATVLRPALLEIQKQNEKIDLVIVTHYDNDHIGGITSLINDREFDIESFVGSWLLNVDLPLTNSFGEVSIAKLRTLKGYLDQIGKLPLPAIAGRSFDLYGAKIAVLSPNQEGYTIAKHHIEAADTKIGRKTSDHTIPLDEFRKIIANNPVEDTSISNGASIAIHFSYKQKSILLLADAFPSVVCESLRQLGVSEQQKLKVDYVKLSHHGSKFNISNELINLLACNNYIISSNGLNKDNLPHKETIARLLLMRPQGSQLLSLLFTCHDNVLNRIFQSDTTDVYEHYNFKCIFPTTKPEITLF